VNVVLMAGSLASVETCWPRAAWMDSISDNTIPAPTRPAWRPRRLLFIGIAFAIAPRLLSHPRFESFMPTSLITGRECPPATDPARIPSELSDVQALYG